MRFSRYTPPRALVAVLVAGLALAGCKDSKDDKGRPLLEAAVSKAAGGTFSAGALRVTIPANALSADATLTVRAVANPPAATALQLPGSEAFDVALAGANGAAVTLSSPALIELQPDAAPIHPNVGEIATLDGTSWTRIHASMWKPASNRVIALSSQARATYRVMTRVRQLATGPAVARGRDVMLYDTFGNEAFFGGVVGLQDVLNNVAPATAVGLGAQVDLARVPAGIVAVMVGSDLAAKDAALQDPAITRALVKAGAVVGVKGVYASADPADDVMTSVGLTCALCHVKVTPTTFQLTAGPAALPIGAIREDGVANERMDAGKILSFTPFAVGAGQATVDLLAGWGPNAFDIRALPDNVLDDGINNPTDTPPLWNFIDLEQQGYTFGWDGLFVGTDALASQAEAVYDLVMHGNGAFGMPTGTIAPALAITPPQALVDALVAAETNAPGNDIGPAQKLLDLQQWMRSIPSPAPAAVDEAKAEAGFRLFYGRALCSTCHTRPDLSGPGLFTNVTATPPTGGLAGGVHVPSLRGVAASAPYFHDDSAADLAAAVDQVASVLAGLGVTLDATDRTNLVEYLKSL